MGVISKKERKNKMSDKVKCLVCEKYCLSADESVKLHIGPVCIKTRHGKDVLRAIELTLKKLNKKNPVASSYYRMKMGRNG